MDEIHRARTRLRNAVSIGDTGEKIGGLDNMFVTGIAVTQMNAHLDIHGHEAEKPGDPRGGGGQNVFIMHRHTAIGGDNFVTDIPLDGELVVGDPGGNGLNFLRRRRFDNRLGSGTFRHLEKPSGQRDGGRDGYLGPHRCRDDAAGLQLCKRGIRRHRFGGIAHGLDPDVRGIDAVPDHIEPPFQSVLVTVQRFAGGFKLEIRMIIEGLFLLADPVGLLAALAVRLARRPLTNRGGQRAENRFGAFERNRAYKMNRVFRPVLIGHP
jgi:hypothetical protein